MKKSLSHLLAAVLMVSLLPMGSAQAAPAVAQGVWPSQVDPVLSDTDAARYRKLFQAAEEGNTPSPALIRALDDTLLVPHVQAVAWFRGGTPGYEVLSRWLAENPSLPESARLYQLAVAKRPPAPQRCTTHKVKKKVAVAAKKHKKGKKAKPHFVTKTVTEKTCQTIGPRPDLPRTPTVIQAREERKAALERLREQEYDGLPPTIAAERRRILGTVWKARQQGNFSAALEALDSASARRIVGQARWQTEVVKLADKVFAKQDWPTAYRVATIAGNVGGPDRDTALWIAGQSAYRMGRKADALAQWQKLASEEHTGSRHFSRVSYWGARTAAELGQSSLAQKLLNQAAKDPYSFYGQLALERLGAKPSLAGSVPEPQPSAVQKLLKVPAARRALALAQVGQTMLAQEEFRSANDDLPYDAARALASIGVHLRLPAIALFAGTQLQEQGETLIPALYPTPPWKPTGGTFTIDPALVMGIMRQESAFYPRIGSAVGAQGLMQIMPATARFITTKMGVGNPTALADPANNIAMGQRYVQYLIGQLDGNVMMAIAAYNGGAGNVNKWLRNGKTPGHDPLLWLESIPFDETRDYVQKVMANVWIYQQLAHKNVWSRSALADGYWPLQGLAAR